MKKLTCQDGLGYAMLKTNFFLSLFFTVLLCPLNSVFAGIGNSDSSSDNLVSILPEQSNVSGTVTDVEGIPLPGATVVVKGTTTGTTADFDGNFTIAAGSDATLIFSYIGYKRTEVRVDGKSTVNVALEEDSALLDEVVVVGYGTQKKGEVTAAISSVQAEQA